MRPWDYHPDITRERLVLVAQLMARGRGDALDRHEPELGDDAWTRGVRAFRFCCHQLTRMAGLPQFEWLSVPAPGRKFQFRIGTAPMRFYRGLAEEPKPNMLQLTELEQELLPFGDGVFLTDVKLRIAVETDFDGSVAGVYFVAIRGVDPETIWRIPFETAVPLVVDLSARLEPPVDLAAPEVGMWEDEQDDEDIGGFG